MVYARFRRWSRSGVLERLFAALREQDGGDANCFGLDSTSAEVHPDGTGVRKTNGPQSIGKSRGGWNTKIHMVSASNRQAMIFCLSDGQTHDTPEGRALLESWAEPVVSPKANRKAERDCDRETCKLRNEIERLFRRFKGCRRLFTRFNKLDATYLGFVSLAAIVEMMKEKPSHFARNFKLIGKTRLRYVGQGSNPAIQPSLKKTNTRLCQPTAFA